jgi:hypothetical protein
LQGLKNLKRVGGREGGEGGEGEAEWRKGGGEGDWFVITGLGAIRVKLVRFMTKGRNDQYLP